MRQKFNLVMVISATAFIVWRSLSSVGSSSPVQPGINAYVLHAVAYFGLAGAFMLYFHDTELGHLEAVLAATGIGFGMEIIQGQIPYRYFGWTDAAANLAGASIVLLDHRVGVVHRVIEFEDMVLEKVLSI